ncbi:hypothetical protein LJC30_06375 [Odoribacter sp. OttesenSCG-928-L07]|nr:hypothetical protein [Odoribacter sp. OttesenSCG-928-L07]
MNYKILFIGIAFISTIKLNAQTTYITDSEKDIYWQPNTIIEFSDYKAQSDETCLMYNEKYGLTMVSSIDIRGVVDISKKKGKYDKFYLAPVFCKSCSCILTEDTLTLEVDRLIFDLAELSARNARRELLDIQKEMNADNTYSMFFTTIKNKWTENMYSISGTIIREVLIEKKDSAYVNWRELVDELLIETESYITKPEECYRLIKNQPIEKGYKMPKTIMGDMRNKNEE